MKLTKMKIAICLPILLFGCGGVETIDAIPPDPPQVKYEFIEKTENGAFYKWVDPETGCRYLIYSGFNWGDGITIAFNSDGTLDCPEVNITE